MSLFKYLPFFFLTVISPLVWAQNCPNKILFDGSMASGWTAKGAETALNDGCGNTDLFVYVLMKGKPGNYLQSLSYDLSACRTVSVNFFMRSGNAACTSAELEDTDTLAVQFSIDSGQTWKRLQYITGDELSDKYEEFSMMLNPVPAGAKHFMLRFLVTSNPQNDPDSWLIDDVSIANAEQAVVNSVQRSLTKVAFMASARPSQTVDNNKEALIRFDEEAFDVGRNFKNNTFTAPDEGIYHFDAHVRWKGFSHANNYMWIGVFKNDTIQRASTAASSNNDFGTMISTNLQLSQGDKVTVKVRQSSGTKQHTFGLDKNTWFTGFKVY